MEQGPTTTAGDVDVTDEEPQVFAAGGIVVRDAKTCLVHRPRYDDWSFPKGKLDPGESFETAAHREVLEETGLDCELGAFVDDVRYRDAKGRAKLVRYWVMHPTHDEADFTPNNEIDEIRWLGLDEARRQLTYRHDRELLDRAIELDAARA